MAVAAMKHMALNFVKLNKFKGVDFRRWQNKMHFLEESTIVELGSHQSIEESLRMQDNDKPKGKNVVSPLVVNMVEHNNSFRYTENRGNCKYHDNTKADPNQKSKVTC
ncbi:hypothetical protein Tco_0216648 [Tanacetum coccineum]